MFWLSRISFSIFVLTIWLIFKNMIVIDCIPTDFLRYLSKRFYIPIFLLMAGIIPAHGQQAILNLEKAYNLAENNYPLIKDKPLLESISETNQQILNRQRLPTLNLVGLGQLQSENLQIGGDNPNSPINIDVPLESYRGYLDLNFNLFDGGLIKANKKAEESQLLVNQQALKVNLRNLKDQVNSLFLSTLLQQQQRELLKTSMENIEANIDMMQAGVDNGTVLESELSKLKVRKIELESEGINLEGNINATLEVLSKLLGTPLTNETQLLLPEALFQQNELNISRPEQQFFEYQSEFLESQKGKINASRLPKLSLFAQGGIGYPNPLNFSDISTSTYGLGGLRLNWNVFDWGIAKKEKDKIELQKEQIAIDRQVFEFNIDQQQENFRKKLEALDLQIEKDKEIVALQSEILKQSAVQLQEGVINSNDYLIQVNAELSARQQMELHLVQKQKLQIEYLTLFGKL